MDAVAIAEKQEANGIATQTQGHIRCLSVSAGEQGD
jgi:hypothetical protein